jgi:hypothetical protein
MDLSIGELVLIGVVMWIVNQICLGIMDAFTIVKLQERVDVLKKLQEIIHQVKIEKRDDIEYWYDADSHHFLGQGSTTEEVIAVLKFRFPEHIFLLEDVGGVAAQTGWKLMTPEEFKQVQLTIIK